MAPTIPTTEPSVLRAGETWAWDITLSDFPASEGWTLTYTILGPSKIQLEAEVAGGVYQVRATAAETAELVAGPYTWAAQVSLDGATYSAGRSGALELLPNLGTAAAAVAHAAEMLPLVEAAIKAHLTGNLAGVENWSVNGRSVARMSLEELKNLRDQYRREVDAARAAATGRTPFTPIEAVMRAPA